MGVKFILFDNCKNFFFRYSSVTKCLSLGFFSKFFINTSTVKPVSKVPLKVSQRIKKMPPSKNPIRKVPPKMGATRKSGDKMGAVRKAGDKMGAVRKVGDKQVMIRRNAKFIKRKGKNIKMNIVGCAW